MKQNLKNIPSTIILIDFNNQVWRNHHATERKMKPNSEGIHTGSILGLNKTLAQAINRSKSLHSLPKLVICEDRTPTRKRQLYTSYGSKAFKDYPNPTSILYKGNRPKKDVAYDPVQLCKDYVGCIPHTSIWADGEEADDVIAAYVCKNQHHKIILYSSDRDLWQLLDEYPNLEIYMDGSGESPTPEMLKKKFDTDSFSKVVLHKIIRGDHGDNVKGIRNYQFKKTLQAFTLCDGSLEDYLKCLVEIFGEEHKNVTHFLNNINLLLLNQKLVTLREDLTYQEEIIKTANFNKWRELCFVFETPSLLNSSLLKIF